MNKIIGFKITTNILVNEDISNEEREKLLLEIEKVITDTLAEKFPQVKFIDGEGNYIYQQ